MKKFLALALALVMALAMAACGCSSETAVDPTDASNGAETYTVGICQLVQHEALDAATAGFKDALTEAMTEAGATVKFSEQNASGDSANCAQIANTFVSNDVDLIMANATAALQASAAATGDIPVLATSITDYATALSLEGFTGVVGGNISGTTDLAPLDQQAAMLVELFPEAKNVGLLYCSAEANSIYQVTVFEEELKAINPDIVCTAYPFTDTNDLQTIAMTAAENSDVIYVPTDNTAASNTGIIDAVCLEAGVPVVAGEEGICAGCGVATLSISYYDLGVATGEMAAAILLEGADISTMEVQAAAASTKKYDAERCAALGITPPADYVAIAK